MSWKSEGFKASVICSLVGGLLTGLGAYFLEQYAAFTLSLETGRSDEAILWDLVGRDAGLAVVMAAVLGFLVGSVGHLIRTRFAK